jgi:hypothetical protein
LVLTREFTSRGGEGGVPGRIRGVEKLRWLTFVANALYDTTIENNSIMWPALAGTAAGLRIVDAGRREISSLVGVPIIWLAAVDRILRFKIEV